MRRAAAGAVLYDEEGHELCELNDTASALWELCDGETAPEEMVDAICEACNVTREVAVDDVDRTLRALAEADMIAWSESPTT